LTVILAAICTGGPFGAGFGILAGTGLGLLNGILIGLLTRIFFLPLWDWDLYRPTIGIVCVISTFGVGVAFFDVLTSWLSSGARFEFSMVPALLPAAGVLAGIFISGDKTNGS
jgi:hypothetical protein